MRLCVAHRTAQHCGISPAPLSLPTCTVEHIEPPPALLCVRLHTLDPIPHTHRPASCAAESASAVRTGPVDAAYKAIDALVRVPVVLEDYTMNSVTEGIEALAVTRVIVRPAGDLDQAVVMTAQVSGSQVSVARGLGTRTPPVIWPRVSL